MSRTDDSDSIVLGPASDSAQAVMNPTLVRLRHHFAAFSAPVVVFNKSHSGSRLLAELLISQGVFMGKTRNESNDALPIVPIMELLVERYYPDYGRLWESTEWPAELEHLVVSGFSAHLEGFVPGRGAAWGWKLCENSYILPVIDALFPAARCVHLVRDGRDVAFCDHIAPAKPLWRKIYFDTDQIVTWGDLMLTSDAYRRSSCVYNALHWLNSVKTARAYGSMLRERYMEVRYEDLCTQFVVTAQRLMGFLGRDVDTNLLQQLERQVRTRSIGKFRVQPASKQRAVLRLVEPMLLSLGYPIQPSPVRTAVRAKFLLRRIVDRARRMLWA